LPFNVEDFIKAEVIVGIDGPAHRRIRNIVNRGFVPRRIQALQGRVDAIVADCMSGLDEAAEFDLMSQVAVPIPIRTVADHARRARSRERSEALVRCLEHLRPRRDPRDDRRGDQPRRDADRVRDAVHCR